MKSFRPSPYRTVLAFLTAPFFTAVLWYVLRLAHLAIANGRLEWRQDVLALLFGGVLVGVPLSALVTWTVGVPGYLAVRRLGWLRPTVVLGAGAVIGLGTSFVLTGRSDDPSLLHPGIAIVIGLATAGFWWWMAGQSSASSSRRASSSSRRSSSDTSG